MTSKRDCSSTCSGFRRLCRFFAFVVPDVFGRHAKNANDLMRHPGRSKALPIVAVGSFDFDATFVDTGDPDV